MGVKIITNPINPSDSSLTPLLKKIVKCTLLKFLLSVKWRSLQCLKGIIFYIGGFYFKLFFLSIEIFLNGCSLYSRHCGREFT